MVKRVRRIAALVFLLGVALFVVGLLAVSQAAVVKTAGIWVAAAGALVILVDLVRLVIAEVRYQTAQYAPPASTVPRDPPG